jgi:hypothetical protein
VIIAAFRSAALKPLAFVDAFATVNMLTTEETEMGLTIGVNRLALGAAFALLAAIIIGAI